jgi:OOP family OmpA-OmpF porin
MQINKLLVAVLFGGQAMLSAAVLAEDAVKNYVDSSGGPVTNASGECWRTPYADTTERREECGDKAASEMEVEVVAAPTAGTVTATLAQQVTIAANMLFAFDSAELSDDAMAVIDERIDTLRGGARLTSVMKVEGYTDSTGPEAYNMQLSQRRAQAVADYIVSRSYNVNGNDIEVIGRGEADPVAPNSTVEGRAQNRRVVVFAEGELAPPAE